SLKFGQNDPDLGNYLTGTFVSPGTTANGGTASALSNLPPSGITVQVAEVLGMFRMSDWLFRIADNPVYGYGFSGFIPAQDNSPRVGAMEARQPTQATSPLPHI